MKYDYSPKKQFISEYATLPKPFPKYWWLDRKQRYWWVEPLSRYSSFSLLLRSTMKNEYFYHIITLRVMYNNTFKMLEKVLRHLGETMLKSLLLLILLPNNKCDTRGGELVQRYAMK